VIDELRVGADEGVDVVWMVLTDCEAFEPIGRQILLERKVLE
jgi:hypothetical protein